MMNRHGLIAGAAGTGKTVTLQMRAEQFARLGMPMFVADITGDLAGIAVSGKPYPKVNERAIGNPVGRQLILSLLGSLKR